MIYLYPQPRATPQTGEIKYYAAIIAGRSTNDIDDCCRAISARTTLTRADVSAVITALEDVIFFHLSNGESVRLKKLGSFRPVLRSLPSAAQKDAGVNRIRHVRIVFTPSSYLISDISRNAKVMCVAKYRK